LPDKIIDRVNPLSFFEGGGGYFGFTANMTPIASNDVDTASSTNHTVRIVLAGNKSSCKRFNSKKRSRLSMSGIRFSGANTLFTWTAIPTNNKEAINWPATPIAQRYFTALPRSLTWFFLKFKTVPDPAALDGGGGCVSLRCTRTGSGGSLPLQALPATAASEGSYKPFDVAR
jgi:hypothetical protein